MPCVGSDRCVRAMTFEVMGRVMTRRREEKEQLLAGT